MSNTKVCIVYNDVNHEISLRSIINSGHFAESYRPGKELIWNGRYSQKCFSNFLNLLEKSRYSDDIRSPDMINLLEEWKCPTILNSLIELVESQYDYSVAHNNHIYKVNFGTLSIKSQLFRSQMEHSPDLMFSIYDEFTEDSFKLFIECLHGIKSLPKDETLVDLYLQCLNWKCDEFLQHFDSISLNLIITALSNEDSISNFLLEEIASKKIHELVYEPCFYKLSLQTINRILDASILCENIKSLLEFIKNLFNAHGIGAFTSILSLDLSRFQNEEISAIIDCFSKNSNSSVFQMLNTQFKINNQLIQDYEIKIRKNFEREQEMKKLVLSLQNPWRTKKTNNFVDDIFKAAKEGNLFSMIFLVSNGICVNSIDHSLNEYHDKKCTALHHAAFYNHLSVVEFLINNNANVNSLNVCQYM